MGTALQDGAAGDQMKDGSFEGTDGDGGPNADWDNTDTLLAHIEDLLDH